MFTLLDKTYFKNCFPIILLLILSFESIGQIGISSKLESNSNLSGKSIIARNKLSITCNFFETRKYKSQKIFNIEDIWEVEEGFKFYIGFGYGPETIVSLALPKFSLKFFYPTNNSNLHYFTGGEVMTWLWGTFWTAGDITGGVKYGPLTIENSISIFYYPRLANEAGDKLGPYFHSAANPKIGLYLFDTVWLRFGPSLIVYKKYDSEEWPPIESLRNGKLRFNFELLINTSIGNK